MLLLKTVRILTRAFNLLIFAAIVFDANARATVPCFGSIKPRYGPRVIIYYSGSKWITPPVDFGAAERGDTQREKHTDGAHEQINDRFDIKLHAFIISWMAEGERSNDTRPLPQLA